MSNTTLPRDITNLIEKQAEVFKQRPYYKDGSALSAAPQIYLKRGYIAGATEYAIWKVRHDELKAEHDINLKVSLRLNQQLHELKAEHAALKERAEKMYSALRSLRLSVAAHPDYTGEENEEWTDLIQGADEALSWKEGEQKGGEG